MNTTTISHLSVQKRMARFGPNKDIECWFVCYRDTPCGASMSFFDRGSGLRNPYPWRDNPQIGETNFEKTQELLARTIAHFNEVLGLPEELKRETSAITWV